MADTNTPNYFLDDIAIAQRVNSGTGDINAEQSAAAKTALETLYSYTGGNIVAKVIIATGTYLKVKFLHNGAKLGEYKSRNSVQDDVFTAREYQMNNGSLAYSAATSLALTGTQAITGTGTSQLTATLTRADSTTADVSPKATWVSATPAHATVNSTGLVTGVASGTSVITATFASISNTRTVTVT